jgi:hypothetical protein
MGQFSMENPGHFRLEFNKLAWLAVRVPGRGPAFRDRRDRPGGGGDRVPRLSHGRIAGFDRESRKRDAGRVLVGVVLSMALFAVLHDRWLAGALAGLLFAAIYLRRRNRTDAILCHGAANVGVVGWALLRAISA